MSLKENGQSLIEVIVASFVGILVVTALTFATIFSLRNASFAKNSAQATKLAQEGIEKVRTARDRNTPIAGNFQLTALGIIISWDDPKMWVNPDGRISANCIPNCYFIINSSGGLQYIAAQTTIPALAEQIGQFRRVVILSDEADSYISQKKVTVIVTWKDFAGDHESKLTTILRKL